MHYTVGCLCQEVAEDKEMQFSKQTIAAISEMTFRQCGMKRGGPHCVSNPQRSMCLDKCGVELSWVMIFMRYFFFCSFVSWRQCLAV